jgi:hypothetical protein
MVAETTLDGNPPGLPFTGAEITSFIQDDDDISKTLNDLVTFINAVAQLAATSQVTGLDTALAAKQALSAILTAIAALNATAGLMVQTGASSFTKRSLANSSNITWTNNDGASGNPSADLTDTGVTAGNVGASSHTILGQVDAKGRLSAFVDTLISIAQSQINDLPITGANGGTGVNNSGKTITLGGNINTANSFTTSGNFAVTQTYTGVTSVTFPTSGILATLSINSRTVTANATLAASDNGGIVYCNSATAITITLPKQATAALTQNFNCLIINIGLGDVTVTHEAADIFESPTLLIAQNAQMKVILEIAGTPNTWLGSGGTLLIPVAFTLAISGTLSNITYEVSAFIPYDCVLTDATFGANAGSGTCTLNLSGTNITGGALSVTTTTSTQGFTGANSAVSGQELRAVVSGVSSLANAFVTVRGYRRQ